MQKSYAVFGLGQFGGSLVKAFHAKGAEVLGIDKSAKLFKQGSLSTAISPHNLYNVAAIYSQINSVV